MIIAARNYAARIARILMVWESVLVADVNKGIDYEA